MFEFTGYLTTLLRFDRKCKALLLLKKKIDSKIYLNEGANFKSTFKPTPNHYYIIKSNADVAWCGFMAPRNKLLRLNHSWDNNPSILKSIDEWKSLFVTLNSCEEAASEEMAEKAMDFSTQPDTMLLLRNPINAKALTTKTENL